MDTMARTLTKSEVSAERRQLFQRVRHLSQRLDSVGLQATYVQAELIASSLGEIEVGPTYMQIQRVVEEQTKLQALVRNLAQEGL
jgi:hypothetical protein